MDPNDALKAFKFELTVYGYQIMAEDLLSLNVSSIEMLPKIRKKVGKKLIIFDGGIRSGSDILKAIYLGANIVSTEDLIYGLIVNGSEGVKKNLDLFKEEYLISKTLRLLILLNLLKI